MTIEPVIWISIDFRAKSTSNGGDRVASVLQNRVMMLWDATLTGDQSIKPSIAL